MQKEKSVHDKHRSRLKQRYIKEGLEHFQDHEIIELFLFYTLPRKDTNPIAHKLLNEFGSLSNIFDASIEDLQKVNGIGENSAVFLKLMVDGMKKYRIDRLKKNKRLLTATQAGEFACELLFAKKNEQVWIICLNMKSEIIANEKICDGTLTESPMYPRTIVTAALKHNTAKLIIIHNHPGGCVTPSSEDLNSTSSIIGLIRKLDMDLLDHIITSGNRFYSFSASKIINLNQEISKETSYACQYEYGFLDEDDGHEIIFKQT